MNDEARELLVAAALRNHRQVRGAYFDAEAGGECGMGVLHLAMHATRERAMDCCVTARSLRTNCVARMKARFDLTAEERFEMEYSNDAKGWDFLTLARKIGTDA